MRIDIKSGGDDDGKFNQTIYVDIVAYYPIGSFITVSHQGKQLSRHFEKDTFIVFNIKLSFLFSQQSSEYFSEHNNLSQEGNRSMNDIIDQHDSSYFPPVNYIL